MTKNNEPPSDGQVPLTAEQLADVERLLSGVGEQDQDTKDAMRLLDSIYLHDAVEVDPVEVQASNAELGFVPEDHTQLIAEITAKPQTRY